MNIYSVRLALCVIALEIIELHNMIEMTVRIYIYGDDFITYHPKRVKFDRKSKPNL